MNIIETHGLTKTFGNNGVAVHALRGIDLKVAEGEFVSLIGPSGSGKSTLMAILGCLDSPSEGRYLLDGEAVEGLSGPALARIRNEKVGFVFQNYNLLPKASIAEERRASAALRGRSAPGAAPAGAGAAGARRDPGEGQRPPGGALGRAAAARRDREGAGEQPGGPAGRRADRRARSKTGAEVLELFQELHANGNTVILVTHDPHNASLAQRQVELYDGLDPRRGGRVRRDRSC